MSYVGFSVQTNTITTVYWHFFSDTLEVSMKLKSREKKKENPFDGSLPGNIH